MFQGIAEIIASIAERGFYGGELLFARAVIGDTRTCLGCATRSSAPLSSETLDSLGP